MNIDPEFVKTTTKFIDDTLEAYKAAGVSPTVGDIWDCENVGDFLCGFFVGELVGSILSAFQYSQKRLSNQGDEVVSSKRTRFSR